MANRIMHIHREVIHHGAEICLLRDLYLGATTRPHEIHGTGPRPSS
jgi:hypothetical protein